MPQTAADDLIDTIHAWDVNVVFGFPGDGINGIMEALREQQDKIRFIQVRHEEAPAFMACAYAKYTGKPGVCLATSVPPRTQVVVITGGSAGLGRATACEFNVDFPTTKAVLVNKVAPGALDQNTWQAQAMTAR
jgi:glyoxylate carboligase